jgi:hypothetical protein
MARRLRHRFPHWSIAPLALTESESKPFRHHANDTEALVINGHRTSDHLGVGFEAALPQTVTQDDSWTPGLSSCAEKALPN